MKKSKSKPIAPPKSTPELETPLPPAAPWVRHFVSGVFLFGGVLILWALILMSSAGDETARMNVQGWGNYATAIVGNKVVALWHAALMTFASGVLFWILISPRARARAWRAAAAWLLVLIVAGDALWLSRHYVKTMPLELLEENDVIRILKTNTPQQRVALMSQEGFYNFWLTFVFPYHHIPMMNVTQMPRMPLEYKRYLETLRTQALTFWQLSAVGFVLAPAQAWNQIQSDPAMRDAFELVYAYNVAPQDIGVTVIPASPSQPGQHIIMRLKKPAPRYALITDWQKADDEEALRQMASTNFVPFQKVLLAPETAADLTEPTGTGLVGQVQLSEYAPGYRKLKVSNDRPAIMRISEKYDPDWRAWIDKQPVPVRRVDFIFQGILVPTPGLHEVVLKYAPDKRPFLGQWLGILLCLGAGLTLIVKASRSRATGLSPLPERDGL
ncbi:MAG: hypothetical protein HYV35_06835 [Lentisphaerae bacterium]|nr:hypothetical protein [Lentisphaerota bacterium]